MSADTFGLEEPSSQMREMARILRDMFVALRKEGFSEQESLTIVGETIRAQIGGQK